MTRFLILIFIGFNIQVPLAFGQLTIEASQAMARQNFPQIIQYDLIKQSTQFSLSNANKGYLPQFSIMARTTYQSDVTEIPGGMGEAVSQITGQDLTFPSVPRDQYQFLGEINQTLWDGGAIRSQRNSIEAKSEVEKQQLEVDLYAIKERVNQLFFGILALKKQLDQIDLLQHDLGISYEKILAYIENGTAQQSDLDVIRVEQLKANQRRAELVSANNAYRQMLAAMTGDSAALTDSLIKPEMQGFRTEELTIRRPELRMFDAQKDLLVTEQHQITSRNLPKIGLFAQGGYGNPGLNMFEPGFTPYYLVGARLTWNISGFYTQNNTLQLINIRKQQIDIQRDVFLYNTRLSITRTNHEILKLEEQIRNDEEIIRLRSNIRASAEAKVANGILSVSDLVREINAENRAMQDKALNEIQLLMSVYNLRITTNN